MNKLGSFEEEDSLGRFRQKLERNTNVPLNLRPTRVPRASFDVRRTWDGETVSLSDLKPKEKGGSNWLNKFFWGAAIFFIATLAVAFYVLFYSTNIVSANNIDLEVKGPTQLRSGEELNLETNIRNRNKVTLRDVSLTITYPAGTVDSLETNKELPLWREQLSDLNPGQSVAVGSRAIIYGAQNSKQKVVLKMEYHIPDSNAVFSKEMEYDIIIGSGTIDISFSLPSEINSGKTFTSNLKIISNAKSVLRQVVVKVDYPSGFNFDSADLNPASSNNIWYLGDLAPGVSREINLTGSLVGQSEEVKSFKVTAGLDKSGGSGEISTEYGGLFQTVNLKRDFVSVSLNLKNKTSLTPGSLFNGSVEWANNLPDKVIDGSLELFLSGNAIDKRSVDGNSGFYNSLTNSIVWDKSLIPSLAQLNPGENGQSSFEFSILPLSRMIGGSNSSVGMRLVFKGTRVTSDEQSEEVVSETEKSLKIGTLAKFSAGAIYSVGPFRNTGPLPPKVGEETTYTTTWTVSNSTNQLKQVRVRAKLPLYVKWLSAISPLDEKVIYDKTNNEVVWDLGAVEPGVGDVLPNREASFQISITPSLSQLGGTVDLVKDISFEGVDSLTGQKIMLTASDLNTKLLADPSFTNEQGLVTE